jgi:hypothetical protein
MRVLSQHNERCKYDSLSGRFRPVGTAKEQKKTQGVLTDGLEVPSKQYLEPVELLVGHLLGSQPRIGLGDANLHVLQT